MNSRQSDRASAPTYLFMASEVRSGSTYIAELISYSLKESLNLEVWDLTKERLRDFNDYSSPQEVEEAVSSLWLSPQNFRSSKIMCAQLSIMNRCARSDSDLADLVFGPNAKWIVVRRRNRIRQAVSLAVARETGVYHSYEQQSAGKRSEVSVQSIEAALRAVMLSDEYLRLFSAIPAVCAELFYEDILADPMSTIGDALRKMGLLEKADDLKLADAKLIPDRIAEKADLEARFADWFLENHHPIPDRSE